MSAFEPPVPAPAGPVSPIHPGAPPPDPERPEGLGPATPVAEQRWRPWSAWVALVAGFAGALFGGVIVALVAAAFGADLKDPPPSVQIISTIVQDIALVLSALAFANMVTRPRPWQFSLRRPLRGWPTVGWFVLAYVAFVTFSAVWISALGLENTKDKPGLKVSEFEECATRVGSVRAGDPDAVPPRSRSTAALLRDPSNLHLGELREILPFSLKVFGSNALAFLSRNTDNILIGRFPPGFTAKVMATIKSRRPVERD